jgi:hypothetical protein
MTPLWILCGGEKRLLFGLLLLVGLIACGDDDTAALECGAGTVQKEGECIASVADAGTTVQPKDAGTTKVDSGGTVVVAISCGAGTIEAAGKCVPDPAAKLECGDGTIATAGKCTVAPPPPLNIEGLVISQLSLRNRGQLIGDGGKIHQYYPVEVSIGLKYKGDAAKIPVVIALGEPPDPTKTAEQEKDLGFCLVGGFDVDHPGGTTATESIASVTLQIPKGCLKGTETSRTMSPIVLIDPDATLGAKDVDSVSRIVPFVKKNEIDPDMAECRIDAALNGTKGTCRVEAVVDASPGLDFELAKLTAESSVVVVDKCAPGADTDRPVSYRCNSSIVREFKIVRDGAGVPVLDANGNQQVMLDADGKPIQATYNDNGTDKLRFVYGPADLDLDVTVMTYGDDDSKLTTAAEAEKLKPTEDAKAVNNVLEDHGLQIEYKIRPAKVQDANAWKPLYLHKQGEQAKAGEAAESGQDKTGFEETSIVPAAPHYYSHGLYVENDCGERNTATCDMNVNPRTDIVSGEWADEVDFVVRACLVPVDAGGDPDAAFDTKPDNNCKELPIRLVRHDTTAVASDASSYGFNFQWADGAGDQSTLRLGWGFHTWNKVDTAGAVTDNEGAVSLGSNLVGYTDILKGWAKGAAYVSLVGSYYDYGISTFGLKLWGDAKVASEFHWEKDWSVTKELKKSTTVWAGCVPIILEIRMGGTAGTTVNLDVVGVTAPLNPDEESETFLIGKTGGALRIGLAQLAVTPYGNMTVIASAAVNAVVVHVGVAGALTMMDMRVPLTGRMWWGLTQLAPLNLRLGVWADLKMELAVMSGRVYLFAEHESIDWCSKRVKVGFIKVTVRYPCGESWDTFWDFTIASWSGWRWNQTLWTSPYLEYNIP